MVFYFSIYYIVILFVIFYGKVYFWFFDFLTISVKKFLKLAVFFNLKIKILENTKYNFFHHSESHHREF